MKELLLTGKRIMSSWKKFFGTSEIMFVSIMIISLITFMVAKRY